MRQFLKKTLIYVVLICFVNVTLIFVTCKIVNAASCSLENKTIIVAGDSTTECAIDDTSTTECAIDGTPPPHTH